MDDKYKNALMNQFNKLSKGSMIGVLLGLIIKKYGKPIFMYIGLYILLFIVTLHFIDYYGYVKGLKINKDKIYNDIKFIGSKLGDVEKVSKKDPITYILNVFKRKKRTKQKRR